MLTGQAVLFDSELRRQQFERNAKEKITISIIDDQVGLPNCISDNLIDDGNVRYSGTYSYEEALEHLPLDKPEVILVNVNLSQIDSFRYIRRLKDQMPGSLILILTDFDDVDKVSHALIAGASGYLSKRTRQHGLLDGTIVCHGTLSMSILIARHVIGLFQVPPQLSCTPPGLSECEQSILYRVALGIPYKQIADRLGVTSYTVRNYVQQVYQKLQLQLGETKWQNLLQQISSKHPFAF
jgi:DNA-binding NarL/FixJ family response regulator